MWTKNIFYIISYTRVFQHILQTNRNNDDHRRNSIQNINKLNKYT